MKFLKDLEWEWQEKVDGCNVRVGWDGHKVSFGGRTDNANLQASLVNFLTETFGTQEAEQLFEQTFGEREAVLFGEGYGARIQKAGGRYISNGVGFIAFDLLVGDNYQSRESVESCARMFGVSVVPVVGKGTLEEAVQFVRSAPISENRRIERS